jgi:Zn-dependent protease
MNSEYNTVYIPEGYGKIRFSRVEIKHILIGVAALTLAFTIVLNQDLATALKQSYNATLPLTLGVAAFVVLAGFLLHELGHKFVAQRYGAWAEFRMFPMGLLLAVMMSFFGFLFAAPGAVYIAGRVTKKQNGLISLAGPIVNLAIGGIFLTAWLFFPFGATGMVLNLIAVMSLFLCGFNLIPMPPLDGYKIATWNIPVYVAMVAGTGVSLMLGWGMIKIAGLG